MTDHTRGSHNSRKRHPSRYPGKDHGFSKSLAGNPYATLSTE